MTQRHVVITGGNTGLGKETAVALAAAGDHVVIACRNAAKAADAIVEITRRSHSDHVESVPLDLADTASIRRCALELAARLGHVDVLVNNAGLMLSERELTADGFETTFGVNHLGTFLLTAELADQLRRADAPRVINLASAAHFAAIGGLNFDDLMGERHYNGWLAYGRSKLANILFTRELARRWSDEGIAVNCVHPGLVRSQFGRDGDTTGLSAGVMALGAPLLIDPVAGADTAVWLACSEEGGDLSRSGSYWSKRSLGLLSPWARRDSDAQRLWAISESLLAAVH